MSKLRRPSPALAVALVALFSSLTGTAVAASVVPLAKKALFANNAGKLQGKTAAQVAALPGPATSAASLVSLRTAAFSLNPMEDKTVIVPCAAGEKAAGGGFTYDGTALVQTADNGPTADGAGWQLYLINFSSSQGASGTAQVVCVR